MGYRDQLSLDFEATKSIISSGGFYMKEVRLSVTLC
jgi:hypothetical protein